ncbi:diguanylate cyclase [Photobacterium kagoshimensis]|uniref:diguanylate cyclase n=1 Tax=Photobacterium kagoshimensis TaxID=2910242 RepID=UPI003D149872
MYPRCKEGIIINTLHKKYIVNVIFSSTVIMCASLVVLLFYEHKKIHDKVHFEINRAKEYSELNKQIIIHSELKGSGDLVKTLYMIKEFRELNVAYENGTNISNSELVTSNFDSKSRPWYQCARKKKESEYCISDIYENAFPPYDLVFTLSYPIFVNDLLLGVGLTDIRKEKIDRGNYLLKFKSYDPKMNAILLDFELNRVIDLLILLAPASIFIILIKSLIVSYLYGLKIDALSGLRRRDTFKEHKVDNRTKAFCFFDLDNFKKINDNYGHDIGDKAIRAFSDCIKSGIRESDVAFRWGGEEFLVILRGKRTSSSDIHSILDRLRYKVESIDLEGIPKFTVSIGFAEYRHGLDIAQCLKNADVALYRAKQAGRNCVIGYQAS